MIKQNLIAVQKKMEHACTLSSRQTNNLTLIAVSKTKPISLLEEAYEAGVRDFGENKVQELVDKYDLMPKDIKWHMIGHLQRNKVKYIIDKVALIHSVDSIRLAETIEQEASKKNVEVDILVEVNIANEQTKFGIYANDVEEVVRKIANLPHIHIKGLMTIAPFVDNPEDNRVYFSNLHKLSVDIAQKNIDNVTMSILSMGMSNDYQAAIEEGASMIRVGTGIFGERNYN